MDIRSGAQRIQAAMDEVSVIMARQHKDPALRSACRAIKRYQSARFMDSYHDLLSSSDYGPACKFFLSEIYGDRDFSQRDHEFSRIAGAIERIFPRSILEIAVDLAELHAETERLDAEMATFVLRTTLEKGTPQVSLEAYTQAWNGTAAYGDRRKQLNMVLHLGRRLNRVTRIPGVRISLRAMRIPARAAQLTALQDFLERGLDTFCDLSRIPSGVDLFLQSIEAREHRWMASLTRE
jgi:hypothetical protein